MYANPFILLLGAAEPPLHPAARDKSRRWALDCFAAVGAELRQRGGGTAVVSGEAGEHAAEQVLAEAAEPPNQLATL